MPINPKPFLPSDKLARTEIISGGLIAAEDLNREFDRIDAFNQQLSKEAGALRTNITVNITSSTDNADASNNNAAIRITLNKVNPALPAYVYYKGIRFEIPLNVVSFSGSFTKPLPEIPLAYLCLHAKKTHKTFAEDMDLCGLSSSEWPNVLPSCEVDVYSDEVLTFQADPSIPYSNDPDYSLVCIIATIIPTAAYFYNGSLIPEISVVKNRSVSYNAISPEEVVNSMSYQEVDDLIQNLGYAASNNMTKQVTNGGFADIFGNLKSYLNRKFAAVGVIAYQFSDKIAGIAESLGVLANRFNSLSAQMAIALAFRKTPIGSVIMYRGSFNVFDTTGLGISGDAIGWAICNGENGTFDLRGHFIVGATTGIPGTNSVADTNGVVLAAMNATGGERKHTLTISELPTVTPATTIPIFSGGASDGAAGGTNVSTQSGGPNSAITIQPFGSNTPHNTVPPYTALAYIQRIS
jgi:hypothetical protein